MIPSETPETLHSIHDWGIPSIEKLMHDLYALAGRQNVVKVALLGLEGGVITDGESRESLEGVVNCVEQVAVLAWMARNSSTAVTVEAGFGMGTTAMVITAARAELYDQFHHRVFDPYGLGDGRGLIAQSLLNESYHDQFELVRCQSQIGMSVMASECDEPMCRLILIDGCHLADAVFADFYAADQIIKEGGWIVFDDADAPAVETVINFIIANRSDYLVSRHEIPNTAIAFRIGRDERTWDHFCPFPVPQQTSWPTPIPRLGSQ